MALMALDSTVGLGSDIHLSGVMDFILGDQNYEPLAVLFVIRV